MAITKEIKIVIDTKVAEAKLAQLKKDIKKLEADDIAVDMVITSNADAVQDDIEGIKTSTDNLDAQIIITTNSEDVVDDLNTINEKLTTIHDVNVNITETMKNSSKQSQVFSGSLVNASNAVEQMSLSNARVVKQEQELVKETAAVVENVILTEKMKESIQGLTKEDIKQMDAAIKLEEEQISSSLFGQTTMNEMLAEEERVKRTTLSIDKKITAEAKKQVKTSRKVGSNAGLDFSVAQLAREGPAFLYSMELGFMAISNNIPIFIDNMTAVEESGTNAWKAVGKSLTSTTVLLSLAVVAFTWLGPKIIAWFSSMTEGADSYADALERIKENKKVFDEELKTMKLIADLRKELGIDENVSLEEEERRLYKRRDQIRKDRIDIQTEYNKIKDTVEGGSFWDEGDKAAYDEEIEKLTTLKDTYNKLGNELKSVQTRILSINRGLRGVSIDNPSSGGGADYRLPKKQVPHSSLGKDYSFDTSFKAVSELDIAMFTEVALQLGYTFGTIETLIEDHRDYLANITDFKDPIGVHIEEDPVVSMWKSRLQAASEYGIVAANLTNAIADYYASEVELLEAKGVTEGKEYDAAIKRREKAAVAGVVMSTASAIMSTWSSYMENPGSYAGAILAGVQTVALLYTAKAQLNNIKSGTLNSGASGGGASPSYNVIAENQYNPMDKYFGEGEDGEPPRKMAPIKAYVVSKDVTTQQELDRQTATSASIG